MTRRVLSAGLCTILVGTILVGGLIGCESMNMGGGSKSSVVGTWQAQGGPGDRPFTFGSVSFVGDKTFTAEAKYNNQTRVQTGTWMTKGNELHLTAIDDTKRDYTYKVSGDTLTVTEPKSGHSISFNRVKPMGK
jgi:hypothetical protein